jgi:hypothetical protein
MRVTVAIICALAATSAAAEVGIGVSAKTDSATVYVPVTVGRFMIEPYLRATDRESDQAITLAGSPSIAASLMQTKAQAIGVGIFRVVPLAERVTMYYGGRIGRIDEELEAYADSGTISAPPVPELSQSSTVEGHEIIPTLGFHYGIAERFSVGGEVGLDYSDVELTSTNLSSPFFTQTSRTQLSTTDTRAEIVLRFFF